MIYFPYCDDCEHIRKERIDGWNVACDAFPKGIPAEHLKQDVRKLKECSNDIGYKEKTK